MTTMNQGDADRLKLLDRIAKRLPELHLGQHEIEWQRLDDGHEALPMDGGGIDGGKGVYSPTPATTFTRSGRSPRSSPATSAAS